ncbi:hypothetical protein C8R44DRAFT_869911 [Mycena epipterygia]|nr:hypothetical protein C8R44DRAFT_869911 [Mycena epipterygia]
MFSFYSSGLCKNVIHTQRKFSRAINSSLQRPRRFWDMHLPKTALDYAPRFKHDIGLPEIPNVGIPNENLPEPWTCDWRAWGLLPYWLSLPGGIAYRLRDRLNITNMTPLMFRSTESSSGTTVFCASGKRGPTFYLYDEPSEDVYQFEHGLLQDRSAKEFIEKADWNKMTYEGTLRGPFNTPPSTSKPGHDSHKCLRLGDLTSETLWKYEPRVMHGAYAAWRATIDAALHRCFFIPDTQLPEPWSCNWEVWHGWKWQLPLLYQVERWFNLPDPLNAIMFRTVDYTTIFESRGVFYLYDAFMGISPRMFRFVGCFSSVEDFIESADWNEMQRLEYEPLAGAGPTTTNCQVTFPRSSGGGFRTAVDQPYQKRTLWDMAPSRGSWEYQPRFMAERGCDTDAEIDIALRKWGSVPDEQLPEPWSCNWARWGHVGEWFEQPFDLGCEKDLQERYGVAGLVPVMFISYGYDRGPMILSADDIYYLYNHSMDDWLMRFDGTYTSVQDFIENGDWNRMKIMDALPLEDFEEEEFSV